MKSIVVFCTDTLVDRCLILAREGKYVTPVNYIEIKFRYLDWMWLNLLWASTIPDGMAGVSLANLEDISIQVKDDEEFGRLILQVCFPEDISIQVKDDGRVYKIDPSSSALWDSNSCTDIRINKGLAAKSGFYIENTAKHRNNGD
ncbi:hypothetical protein SDJN02_27676, partial [Cucurbita argyrosperma subsp. argyrosperma]